MKVVVAVDSFKGSLSSLEAGEAIATGVKRVYPDAETVVRPLADGGEGTVDALTKGMGGTFETVRVSGPLGTPVDATYGILEATDSRPKTAIMEMSQAAGITQVPDELRNPMNTTTYGVGEMIVDAIRKGCRHFIVGIGGSATNDGGFGMLSALGYAFLNADGEPVAMRGEGLRDIAQVNVDAVLPELAECTFKIACDVTNPLCGEHGSSAVYGPQKGATPEMIQQLDAWLAAYAELSKEQFPQADATYPGTGAAGGLGFAFLTYTNAVLESGITIVLDETHLEEYVRDCDVVVTGEGRLDGQTAQGKAPIGVASVGKKYGKKVLAFSGIVTPDAGVCNEHGIDAFFPILRSIVTLPEAMNVDNAAANLSATVEQAFRLMKVMES